MRTFLTTLFLLSVALSANAAWQPASSLSDSKSAPVTTSSNIDIKMAPFISSGGITVQKGKISLGSLLAMPATLLFRVNGNVGASKYCDANGQNCGAYPGQKDDGSNAFSSGVVLMFDQKCPDGWTRYSAADNRTLIGAGGKYSINWTNTGAHTHTVSYGNGGYTGNCCNTVNELPGSPLNPTVYWPPYKNLVFCKKS